MYGEAMSKDRCYMFGWYVIQVQTNYEDKTIASIEQKIDTGLVQSCFTPRWQTQKKVGGQYRDIIRYLIPGYIIALTNNPFLLDKKLRDLPEFARVLKSGDEFIPLDDGEVSWIKRYAQGKDYIIPMSEALKVGDQIVVTSGPLKDRFFKIVRINRHKSTAYIEIDFLGRKKEVPIGLKIVSKKDS